MIDSLTILRSRGRRLAKLIRAGGDVEGYDRARLYDMHTLRFGDLEGLRDHLAALAHRPEHCVVRGAIVDPSHAKGVRRLVHPDKETGEVPTLTDAPRLWVALDCDGIPAPEDMDRRDLEACGILARLTMPDAFHSVACIVQATAGHAIKPGLRLRLWFLLERPLTGIECQRWLRGVPGVDPSTLRAAQVTYTAAPLFVDMLDPLPRRLAMLPGLDAVPCPTEEELQPPSRPPANENRTRNAASTGSSDRYVRTALMRACSNIATAPVDSRHPTAVSEAWGLARFVVAGLMTADEVIRAVDGALEQAGKPKGEGAKIAAWAVSQRTDSGNLPTGGRE
ncbi:hypothetical protein [Roseomonas indoligenes]|uniref:Uncharacterized protein n=1 Tax=Roseomonas indoligenes TaxID=2820811 RepID=A0A940S6I8_9PROT|nr:hypothetical protein [Pararoseomonas indoligenes]MBP0493990.1 hypothetical protein [Pararoseomonas indoligenes]